MAALALGSPAHAGLFKRRPHPVDREVTLPRGDVMHYTELGDPNGKTLLFVHGWPTSARLYEPVVRELCGDRDTGFHCIAISQIGFGRSSCPGDGSVVSPSYEADRLDEFIDEMDLRDFAAIVHDWGGPVGVAASLRHAGELSHLVILNSFLEAGRNEGLITHAMELAGGYFSRKRPFFERIAPLVTSGLMQALTSRWLFAATRSDYAEPYEDDELGACRTHAGLNLFAKASDPESIALYDEIAANLASRWSQGPALFLWAVEDPVLGPLAPLGKQAHDTMHALLPQAETHLIFGASHYVQEDRPGKVAREIAEFIP